MCQTIIVYYNKRGMTMLLTKDVKELKLKNKTISIYTDRYDLESFSIGYIAAIEEPFIYINHLSTRGEEDGIILRRSDDIFRIEYDGPYEQKLERLYRLKEQKHRKYLPKTKGKLFNAFLRNIQKHKWVVTLRVGDMENFIDVTGLIEEVKEGKVYMTELTNDAHACGSVIVPIHEIYVMRCDTEYEKDIRLIYNSDKAGKDED